MTFLLNVFTVFFKQTANSKRMVTAWKLNIKKEHHFWSDLYRRLPATAPFDSDCPEYIDVNHYILASRRTLNENQTARKVTIATEIIYKNSFSI